MSRPDESRAARAAHEAPTAGTGEPSARRVPCVGAVIRDESQRMLLILRGHDPGKGLWSIPGGRVEPGESDEEAVIREISEETGLEVTVGQLLGIAERPAAGGMVLEIRDYLAYVAPGSAASAIAGDDAADVRWVTDDEAAAMDRRGELTGGLLAALREWITHCS